MFMWVVAKLFGMDQSSRVRTNEIPPYFRLVPSSFEDGAWRLERWYADVGVYLCEKIVYSMEEADQVIKILERKPHYKASPEQDFSNGE